MNIKLDNQMGGASFYCGEKPLPPGKHMGEPNECFKSGLSAGYIAGLKKKGKISFMPKSKSMPKSIPMPKPSFKPMNFSKFVKAGEKISQIITKKPLVDFSNIDKANQVDLKKIIKDLYKKDKSLSSKYGPQASMTRKQAIDIIKKLVKPESRGAIGRGIHI